MHKQYDACLVLSQALILQLKYTLIPGSHSTFTGISAQSFTYKSHGLTFSYRH
ncbi:hypothetical protein AHAS_Ahas17G0207000 [Arachis hypogaea]